MKERSLGFIGGGRVARIILGGLKKAGQMPATIVASDTNPDVLKKLQDGFPDVLTAPNDNCKPASQDLVFLGLHPPAISGLLKDLKDSLQPGTVVISLAPKLSIAKLREGLGGFDRIVRIIPNAASIIGEGFNPIVFSDALNQPEREEIKTFLGALGKCPEVDENKLEAYAIITAMGPTYLWFQWQELCSLAESYGMTSSEAKTGVTNMVVGAVNTLLRSGMMPEEVMDLVPVKPLGEEEQIIRAMYKSKLGLLYEKLKG